MNASATLTNETRVRKNLSQLGIILGPGESTSVSVNDALSFVNREGWRVHIPPEAGEFKNAGEMSLYFTAPISVTDGYGNHAEGILLGLDWAGVTLTARHLWQLNPAGLQKRTLQLLQSPIRTVNAVGLCMSTPGEFARLPTAFKVGLTQYESTDYRPVHPEWTQQINEIDLLLTFGGTEPEWNVGVFRRCGVRVPIRVIRGSGNWHYYRTENRWKARERDEFVVITWGMMHTRKSGLEMIDVFKKAFPCEKYPDCRFKVKTIGGVIGDLPAGSYRSDDERVEIISADWLPEQMVQFARCGDVMLYLSRGEGCGRPPREAMAMGLPLICADNTGMRPICDERYMSPVETKEWSPATIGGEWAEPDWDQAIEALRWHYENRDEARVKAERGAKWISRNHSPAVQANDIISALNQVDPGQAKSTQNRNWVVDYVPETDHSPAVEVVSNVCETGMRGGFSGPDDCLEALREAGFFLVSMSNVRGTIEDVIRSIGDGLSQTDYVVLCAPSKMYPVKVHADDVHLNFQEWERVLERARLNVVGRVAYGGDYGRDYSLFVISAQSRVRGVPVRRTMSSEWRRR